MSRRWWRILRWSLVGLVSVAMLVVVVCWMLFQHIPPWYEPMDVGPEQRQAVLNDLTRTTDSLSERMAHSDEPFRIRIRQEQINAWMAAREAIWPLAREWLPPTLSDPFIRFAPDGVRLAITYNNDTMRAVLSAQLLVSAKEDAIRVRLAEVAGGSLPVPTEWLREELQKIDAGAWPAGQRLEQQAGSGTIPPLASLLSGAEFPNAWIWWDSKRPYKITDFELEPGAVIITFQPLARSAKWRMEN